MRIRIKKRLGLVRIFTFLIFLGLTTRANASNPLFAYTHIQPSPLTVPAGRMFLGTSSGFGVTSFFQLSTNVLGDIYKIYNAQAKLSLIDTDPLALALTLGWQHYNLHDVSTANPDLLVTTYTPGAVVGLATLDHLAWFFGANTSMNSVTLGSKSYQTSGYAHGSEIGSDLSWAYENGESSSKSSGKRGSNQRKHVSGVGNVLSGGVTYDTTYKLFGLGVSHHWRGLQLGVHYYPNATEYKYLPIIAGGATLDL